MNVAFYDRRVSKLRLRAVIIIILNESSIVVFNSRYSSDSGSESYKKIYEKRCDMYNAVV